MARSIETITIETCNAFVFRDKGEALKEYSNYLLPIEKGKGGYIREGFEMERNLLGVKLEGLSA